MSLDFTPDASLETVVFQTLGAVSLCWDPIPEGVFQSRLAEKFGNELIEFIRHKYKIVDNWNEDQIPEDPKEEIKSAQTDRLYSEGHSSN